jgi:DNA (cytosine-5)-methyltransferase 1
MLKIGSLCSGYGGLDMAVEAYFNAETVWMCDNDKYAGIVIKERWNLPNLGDLKAVDWSTVEPIDILTAGYPCQPFSTAGQRKGEKDERHIWPEIKTIISNLQPKFAILENVRGHLTLGFKEVLQDLTEIGYDARWAIVRASDVGAPHQRARLFIIAYPSIQRCESPNKRAGNNSQGKQRSSITFTRSAFVTNANSDAHKEPRRTDRELHEKGSGLQRRENQGQTRCKCRGCCEALQCTNTDSKRFTLGSDRCTTRRNQGQSQSKPAELGEVDSNANLKQLSSDRQVSQLGWRFDSRLDMSMRSIPNPLVNAKLNTKFVEYMMGLPEGWVTDLDISRSQQFKILGNGVVPQQAYYALQLLCDTPIIEREKQMNLTEALC